MPTSERTSLLGGDARPAAAPAFLASTLTLPARVRALLCGRRALTYADILSSPASAAMAEDVGALMEAAAAPGLGSQAVRGALEALWGASLGAGAGGLPCPPPVSPQWALLGFQGRDPTRDLRSPTFPLALALATAGLQALPALRREALLGALGAAPPFALCLLSTLHMLACHLKLLGGGSGSGGGGGGGGGSSGGGSAAAAAAPPPSFCPCCGAAVREREYGRLAAQSHRGASLRGFVEMVREAGRQGGLGARPAGEVALGELLQLTMRALGAEWRRQGRGEGALLLEPEEVLLARVREAEAEAAAAAAAAAGGGGSGGSRAVGAADTRHLAFPAMLAGVSRKVMEALALASLPGQGAGAEAIRRSQSEAGGPKGGGMRSPASPAGLLSPLHAALQQSSAAAAASAAGAAEVAWGGHARRCVQDGLAATR